MKRVLALINPSAGQNYGKQKGFDIISLIARRGYEVTVFPIYPKDGLTAESILQKEHSYDVIVCVGGDGTLNHVVGQLTRLKKKTPILYIPAGTTNDFARTLGLDHDYKELIPLLDEGELFTYDLGVMNDQYFNYIAAFGAFTAVSYKTDQNIKNALGYAAYVLQTLGSIPDSLNERIHLKVVCDEFTDENDYLFGSVSNTTSVAGMKSPLLEKTSLNDGTFEVILIEAPNNIGEMMEIGTELASGTITNKHIHVFNTRSIQFEAESEFPWTLDGDYGGECKRADIRILEKQTTIFLPKEKRQDIMEERKEGM